MQLDLLAWKKRGGKRPGAGRPRTSRWMPHVSRAGKRNGAFHITARVASGLPSLRMTRIVRGIEQSFRSGCSRRDFRLVHYSIQRDHVHLILEAADMGALGRGIRSLLIRVARAANRVWGRRGCVFLDRYHHHLLATPREVHHAIAYVLRNARKHFARHAPTGWIDPASSGRWFWSRSSDAPSVALPRFWLLCTGWRRHGVIAPT